MYANCELLQRSPQGLSKERRGLQGDENKIENAEQELEPKKRLSCSPCSAFSILFSRVMLPTSVLSARVFLQLYLLLGILNLLLFALPTSALFAQAFFLALALDPYSLSCVLSA